MMVHMFFDVETGELHIRAESETVIFIMLKSSDGNYAKVLSAYEHERMIKKLVNAMELK